MNILSKFQIRSSSGLALTVFELKDYSLTQLINELINDGGDCRTAPATPGLLKKFLKGVQKTGGGCSRPFKKKKNRN